MAKLLAGARNNYPDLVPDASLTANEKRRVLDAWGWRRPNSMLLADVGLIKVPEAVGEHLEINGIKLLAALYYRHVGTPLPRNTGVFSSWSQQGLPGAEEAQAELAGVMPGFVVGERVNTSIGDQFAYRWGRNEREDLFGFIAGFGAGLFILAAAAPWEVVSLVDGWRPYTPPRSPA